MILKQRQEPEKITIRNTISEDARMAWVLGDMPHILHLPIVRLLRAPKSLLFRGMRFGEVKTSLILLSSNFIQGNLGRNPKVTSSNLTWFEILTEFIKPNE
jgi:hypothetical protein